MFDSPIPNKLYFKIGEVSRLVGVRAHVLRYWEKEVSSIRPSKSASNQRRYRRRDVEVFREIRRLLYEERYTLAGARKKLLSGARGEKNDEESGVIQDPVPSVTEVPLEVVAEKTLDHAPISSESTVPTEINDAPQLPLGFAEVPDRERIERVKEGLREIIALAKSEPSQPLA